MDFIETKSDLSAKKNKKQAVKRIQMEKTMQMTYSTYDCFHSMKNIRKSEGRQQQSSDNMTKDLDTQLTKEQQVTNKHTKIICKIIKD